MMESLVYADGLSRAAQAQGLGCAAEEGSHMIGWGPMMGAGWFGATFGVALGLLGVLVLVSLLRFLWIKGDKEKAKR